jgi:Ca2+/Na+ antiporter
MFWGITYICEDYAVPALRTFCSKYEISDAITGSIFIGTGLSLPVFFIALVGLFLSNAAIGVGAVIGGNLFNHLITMPSMVYVAPQQKLKLDRWLFTREMLSYLLSCLLVVWVTQNHSLRYGFSNIYNKTRWNSCLSLSWGDSLVLLVFYMLYVAMTTFAESIQSCLSCCLRYSRRYFGYNDVKSKENSEENCSIDQDNSDLVSRQRIEDVGKSEGIVARRREDRMPSDLESNSEASDTAVDLFPCDIVPMIQNDHQPGAGESSVQYSQVYPSTRNNLLFDYYISVVPHSSQPSGRSTSRSHRNKSNRSSAARPPNISPASLSEAAKSHQLPQSGSSNNSSLQQMRENDGSLAAKLIYLFDLVCYPIKMLIYYTVPLVIPRGSPYQTPGVNASSSSSYCSFVSNSISCFTDRSVVSFLACLVWLGIQSYLLTLCLSILAAWWGVPSGIMGLTVAAWAGNYPAHWSSLILAKKGDGDIGSCNVYGSNVFNVGVGLGLPWMIYSLLNTERNYNAVQDQGVTISMVLLMVVIVVHYILALICQFEFTIW